MQLLLPTCSCRCSVRPALKCCVAAVECAWAGVGGAVLVIGMHLVCRVCWLVDVR